MTSNPDSVTRDITDSKVYELWYARPRPVQPNRLRFFARLRSAELACPRCGWITRFGPVSRGTLQCYDAKRSLWECPSCSLVLQLGVAAWTVTTGRSPSTPPADQLPTLAEARLLRWAFADWHHGLASAAKALRGAKAGWKGGALTALKNVRRGLHSRAKGASVEWAAWGAALFGTLTTLSGAGTSRRGRVANTLVDGDQEAGPGAKVLRMELAEALEGEGEGDGSEKPPDSTE